MNSKKRRDYSEANAAIERLFSEDPDRRINADTVVGAYIEAAQARSPRMPSRQELGESCFWIAFDEGLWNDLEHRDLVCDLLSASEGLEMLSLLPRVMKLREAAEASLARRLAAEKSQELRQPLTDDDIPF